MLNLVYDRPDRGRPYPNLAAQIDSRNGYHGLGDAYPWIAPIRLYYYAQDHGLPINISYVNEPIPAQAFYPVGISWFDFSIDYFGLMSQQVQSYLRDRRLRVLFYYHEGDNPHHEKARLSELCHQHNLPQDCYKFVSGNTQADNIENFVYFPDHELFYWRNGVVWNDRPQIGCEPHEFPRQRQFTFLSRVHKWWRATIAAHLYNQGIFNNSYWSYGNIDIGDQYHDNPIEIHAFPGLEQRIQEFLKNSPYRCDDLSATEHNSHWMFVPDHYANSYCHLVLETFFDADGSNGCFISEKVFKPIRHAQPFVVFGTPHTLSTLRQLGYRTYDEHIDNSYDAIEHNTERLKAVVNTVQKIQSQDMHAWYQRMRPDIVYNRDRFVSSQAKLERLQQLVNCIL